MQTEKLSISLPVDMARMVRRRVEDGAYASNSEVIREALRLWQQREQERGHRLDAIRASLDAAANDPARHGSAEVSARFDRLLTEAEKTAKS
ncbi:type II toxin-antitoxin system ParD family antitoxin [Sinorhizobium meliloti]|uniref:type II toxin-antitoxin system ParD family antitoxin n=1 Tax=Rhizobium meliloti TaxID=382 RepID=UPI000FDAA3F2|nr:type II toxin-antitoxin system ParD family antitoxin [Sinorhizobium meliloti]RVQ54110.1 type II toxin-antitoxin system ParD family antitoxin [Sinorhizobium meliloti]